MTSHEHTVDTARGASQMTCNGFRLFGSATQSQHPVLLIRWSVAIVVLAALRGTTR